MKFLISGFVAFLIMFTGSWLVHGLLLTEDYKRVPQLFRPEADAGSHFVFMVLAFISMGFAFAWIYRQGITPNHARLMQGIRFGIAVAFLTPVPMYLIYYVVQPMELSTTIKQIVGDGFMLVITGIVVAMINGNESRERA